MNQRRKDWSSVLLRGAPLLLLAALALFFYLRYRASLEPEPHPSETQALQEAAPGESPAEEAPSEPAYGELERKWLEATGTPPEWPEDFDGPNDCEKVLETLQALCRRLDTRPYVQEWELPHGTFGLLTGITGDLGSRPPQLDGVLESLDSVRANVSHFVRALGSKRLARLIDLSRKENDLAEPLALALYRWMQLGERCGEEAPRALTFETQYDYAAFLIDTVGGQAYLRRRSPRVEALVSFYALLILDRAVQNKHNPQGVNLRPEIRRCKELMQSQDLVFRTRYLEYLSRMEERWKTWSQARR